jgi:hypothetical protein
MPTGRITFASGISGPSIPTPVIPSGIAGVRGQANSAYAGGGKARIPQPDIHPGYGTDTTHYYAGFVPEVAKANYLNPSNQGRRAQQQFLDNYTPALGVNNPSRMQFSEGYTEALQVFAAPYLINSGGTTVGKRASQPSQKFVSPFSSLPIPTRMPWDL